MAGRIDFQDLLRVAGARIKESRRARGLSQEELADQAGCHRTYVGMLERGEGNPSLGVLFRIAAVLEVDLVELLTQGNC